MFPAFVLSPDMIEIIRKDSFHADMLGMLTSAQLNIIYDEKWFHLFVPKEYGGLDLTLPEAVRVEESIAYADGSVGWVVTLCAGAAMFVGYLDEAIAEEIFSNPYNTCLAGSGQTNGIAKIIEDGFEISGSWPYASGAPHATHFTANCVIEGSGQVQSFIFKKDEVTLQPNWKYIGLNATAGYSFAVNELKVPANRTFIIDPIHARLSNPVYRYPFLQLAESTIAANMLGMCLYFFALAKQLLEEQEGVNERSKRVKNKGLKLVTRGLAEIQLLRKNFYDALDSSWISLLKNKEITTPELDDVSRSSIQLTHQSRNLVNALFPYCGLHAARTDTTINRVWRNINTASQHTLLVAL